MSYSRVFKEMEHSGVGFWGVGTIKLWQILNVFKATITIK